MSRYEWSFCAALAVLTALGVTMEISRMAGKSRKAAVPAAARLDVDAVRVATPLVEDRSAR
jgi:hypothetical protein